MAFRPALVTACTGGILAALALSWSARALPAGESPPRAVAPPGPGGAVNLTLSFTDDSSRAFPIRGEKLADGRIVSDRPTVVFFGTAHCWNTNREAERLVKLYERHGSEARFLVIDLEAPSPEQKALVAGLYTGHIPTVAFLDRAGNVVYDRAGETTRERGDVGRLEELLDEAKRRC